MNRYLEEVESGLIDDWDVVSADPEVLSQQLSEHQVISSQIIIDEICVLSFPNY